MSDAPARVRVESAVTRGGYVTVVVLSYLASPIFLLLLAAAVFGGASGALGSGALALAIAFPLSVPAVAAIAYARTFTSGAKALFEPAVWTFEDLGVDVDSEGQARFAKWDSFVRWRRLAGHYLLYVDRSRYVVVAGESLDADERARLEELLRVKVPQRSSAWLRG